MTYNIIKSLNLSMNQILIDLSTQNHNDKHTLLDVRSPVRA